MHLSQHVENDRFWEVVTLWAQGRLQHEHIVARALAKAVVRDGLRGQSAAPRWLTPGTSELRGAPLVGSVAGDGQLPICVPKSV